MLMISSRIPVKHALYTINRFIMSRSTTLTHPYSIYIWQPPRSSRDEGRWIEPVQVYSQDFALYVANLIHKDSRAVIKVVRYGITVAGFPNTETVERVERQFARQTEQLR
jgi:hypothetical protein